MGGAAAGTKWIHHIQRLSAAKVSAEAVERGQSRVIDASLTLIRERAKLKVGQSIPQDPFFSPFLAFSLIPVILLYTLPALVLLNIPFRPNMRFESIRILFGPALRPLELRISDIDRSESRRASFFFSFPLFFHMW